MRAADEPLPKVKSFVVPRGEEGVLHRLVIVPKNILPNLDSEPPVSQQKVFTPPLTPEPWEMVTKFGQMIRFYPDEGYGKHVYPILKNGWTWFGAVVVPFVAAVWRLLDWDDKRRERAEVLRELKESNQKLRTYIQQVFPNLERLHEVRPIESFDPADFEDRMGKLGLLEEKEARRLRSANVRNQKFLINQDEEVGYQEGCAYVAVPRFKCLLNIVEALNGDLSRIDDECRRTIRDNVASLIHTLITSGYSVKISSLHLVFSISMGDRDYSASAMGDFALRIGELVDKL